MQHTVRKLPLVEPPVVQVLKIRHAKLGYTVINQKENKNIVQIVIELPFLSSFERMQSIYFSFLTPRSTEQR
jgi:hypothetical protein